MLKQIDTSSGRLFFVSDIHGEIKSLEKGLDLLEFDKNKDNLVCAGDLIDRGSDSLNTLTSFLKEDSFHTCLGNHDCFLIDNAYQCNEDLWLYNGGKWWFQEGLTNDEKSVIHAQVERLPFAIEVIHNGYKIGVTHASVPQEFKSWQEFVKELQENPTNTLTQEVTWDRSFIEHAEYHRDNILDGVFCTIHGHTPVKEPCFVGNRLHIDTGLVYGKYLTIAEFLDGSFKFHKFNIKGEII